MLCDDVGEAEIRDRVVRPLRDLRVVPYYGCGVCRAPGGAEAEPAGRLPALLSWIGAQVVGDGLGTRCCGGHRRQSLGPRTDARIRGLLQVAVEHGAGVIACLCPMCELQLGAYRERAAERGGGRIDVQALFFIRLLALALGLNNEPALGRWVDRETTGSRKPVSPAPAGPSRSAERGAAAKTTRRGNVPK